MIFTSALDRRVAADVDVSFSGVDSMGSPLISPLAAARQYEPWTQMGGTVVDKADRYGEYICMSAK